MLASINYALASKVLFVMLRNVNWSSNYCVLRRSIGLLIRSGMACGFVCFNVGVEVLVVMLRSVVSCLASRYHCFVSKCFVCVRSRVVLLRSIMCWRRIAKFVIRIGVVLRRSINGCWLRSAICLIRSIAL